MESPLENPAYRYGTALISAAVIAFVAFNYLEGTVRWVAFGLAAFEVVFVPQILKKAAEQADAQA